MKRTYLQGNATADEQSRYSSGICEFQPSEILLKEQHFGSKGIQPFKHSIRIKSCLLFTLIMFCTITLTAQCFDYQSELLNAESFFTSAIRNQKKAMKATVLEEAQQLVDKSVFQMGLAMNSISLAKENATSCSCEEGTNNANNLYNAIFDFKNLSQKVASIVSIEELKEAIKKNSTFGESILSEISEASSNCTSQENGTTDSTAVTTD